MFVHLMSHSEAFEAVDLFLFSFIFAKCFLVSTDCKYFTKNNIFKILRHVGEIPFVRFV